MVKDQDLGAAEAGPCANAVTLPITRPPTPGVWHSARHPIMGCDEDPCRILNERISCGNVLGPPEPPVGDPPSAVTSSVRFQSSSPDVVRTSYLGGEGRRHAREEAGRGTARWWEWVVARQGSTRALSKHPTQKEAETRRTRAGPQRQGGVHPQGSGRPDPEEGQLRFGPTAIEGIAESTTRDGGRTKDGRQMRSWTKRVLAPGGESTRRQGR